MINLTKVFDITVDNVESKDYPDFCNAYISNGWLMLDDGSWRELTEKELDYINDNCKDFVYEAATKTIY